MKEKSPTLNCNHEAPILLDDQGGGVMSVSQNNKSGTLRSEAHGNVPIVFKSDTFDTGGGITGTISGDHESRPTDTGHIVMENKTQGCDLFNFKDTGDIVGTVTSNSGGTTSKGPKVFGASIRRLTPEECEKLQGFQVGYTRIPYKGRPPEMCPDGPRYKAIGNSWAVPCARWIGKRIQMVEDIINSKTNEEVLW